MPRPGFPISFPRFNRFLGSTLKVLQIIQPCLQRLSALKTPPYSVDLFIASGSGFYFTTDSPSRSFTYSRQSYDRQTFAGAFVSQSLGVLSPMPKKEEEEEETARPKEHHNEHSCPAHNEPCAVKTTPTSLARAFHWRLARTLVDIEAEGKNRAMDRSLVAGSKGRWQ